MRTFFKKINEAAAGAWPVLRILLGLGALALTWQGFKAGALQHREGLALAAGERRALAARIDSLGLEIKTVRLEAATFYDVGDMSYKKVYQMMKSRRFTAAFEAWEAKAREKERRAQWPKK